MIGRPRVHHRLTDSTNERAKELAEAGAPHGTLVTADAEQTAGAAAGTRVVAPAVVALPMLAGSARARRLPAAPARRRRLRTSSGEAQIKWPTTLDDSQKGGRILVEGRPQEGAALGSG